jgi:hypothetical protein
VGDGAADYAAADDENVGLVHGIGKVTSLLAKCES